MSSRNLAYRLVRTSRFGNLVRMLVSTSRCYREDYGKPTNFLGEVRR